MKSSYLHWAYGVSSRDLLRYVGASGSHVCRGASVEVNVRVRVRVRAMGSHDAKTQAIRVECECRLSRPSN